MYLIREILQCRPGKVRDLIHKFQGLGGVMQRLGLKPFRLLTDLSGERFWTLVAEVEVPGLNEFLETEKALMGDGRFTGWRADPRRGRSSYGVTTTMAEVSCQDR